MDGCKLGGMGVTGHQVTTHATANMCQPTSSKSNEKL